MAFIAVHNEVVEMRVTQFAGGVVAGFGQKPRPPPSMLASVVLANLLHSSRHNRLRCRLLTRLVAGRASLTVVEKALLVPEIAAAGVPLGFANITEFVTAAAS